MGYENTHNIKVEVLARCGELTNGNSDYDSDATKYINNLYRGLIAGCNEFGVDVIESWPWARSHRNLILNLEPAYITGTIALTENSATGTLSTVPTNKNFTEWYLKLESDQEFYKVAYHTTSSTTVSLDQYYKGTTGSFNFTLFKLDYDVVDDLILINDSNKYIDFEESNGTIITATLTPGVYSASTLCTEIKTQLEAVGAETYTVTFNEITRKFTIAHGGAFLKLDWLTGTNFQFNARKILGFEFANSSGTTSYTSARSLNAIQRITAPMSVYKNTQISYASPKDSGKISAVDYSTMIKEYPMTLLKSGTPAVFAEVHKTDSGIMKIKFNTYPTEITRVELNYIPVPENLIDSLNSIPLMPEAYRDYLDFGASYYLMMSKSDNRAQTFFELAKAKLIALVNSNRETRNKAGKYYGQIVPRRDMLRNWQMPRSD